MTVGDREQDFPDGMDFFMASEEVLERFALKHDLRIRKYRHAQPVWEFMFLHPRGGIGLLELHRAPPTAPGERHDVWVGSHWYVDDDSVHQRRSRPSTPPARASSAALNVVVALLEEELQRVLGWSVEDLGAPRSISIRPGDNKGAYLYSELERSLTYPNLGTRDSGLSE